MLLLEAMPLFITFISLIRLSYYFYISKLVTTNWFTFGFLQLAQFYSIHETSDFWQLNKSTDSEKETQISIFIFFQFWFSAIQYFFKFYFDSYIHVFFDFLFSCFSFSFNYCPPRFFWLFFFLSISFAVPYFHVFLFFFLSAFFSFFFQPFFSFFFQPFFSFFLFFPYHFVQFSFRYSFFTFPSSFLFFFFFFVFIAVLFDLSFFI